MNIFILVIVFNILKITPGQYNDYSSFLNSNASIAVIVDHRYLHNENILASFQKILSDTIRENLKNGGLNVKYFTWSGIRLKKEYLAAMTVMDCERTWKFYESTRLTSVLLIAITDTDCPRLPTSEAIMIPSIGYAKEFPQMILDAKVQNILKWKTAVVMMDESIVNQHAKLIESIACEGINSNIEPISLYFYSIDDHLRSQKKRQAIREALQPFKSNSQKSNNFIIFSKFYEDIIEMAEDMSMFHVKNQWLFWILEEYLREFDSLLVTQNLAEGTNIAFVLNETLPGCVNSLNCAIEELSKAFVLSISKLITEEQSIYGEISDEEWEALRYSKREKQDEILRTMKEYLKEYSKCASCSKWRIDTAINWGKSQEHKPFLQGLATSQTPNRIFEFINVGYWTPVLGFVTHEFTFPHTTHFFRNITLDIITVHNPPWQILKKDTRGNIIDHSGIVLEVVKELSRMLNFSYKLYDAYAIGNDEQTRQNDTDLLGSLTYVIPYQVVDMLQANKFFMAAVAATVDEPDKKPFNYTIPISIQKYTFISRRPDEVSRIYLFIAPFAFETWASLIAVILITSPVLYLINRLVPTEHLQVKGFCTLKNCFWYVYGALLQQGGMYLPQTDSGRLVIGFWWIVVIVLVTTYCGNLVAFLTFPKFQPGLDYFFQLFEHNDYENYGLRNGTFFEKYAMISTRIEFRKFLEFATIYNNMKEEYIEAVKEGSRVNIDWRINLQLIIQHYFEKDKECSFALGKENFLEEQIALMVPSNSPYLNLINDQITRLSQMGFIERWHQINLPSMDKCSGRGRLRQITNHKVNLDDMQGCFIVLLLGFFMAVFALLVECGLHMWHLKRTDENKTLFSN